MLKIKNKNINISANILKFLKLFGISVIALIFIGSVCMNILYLYVDDDYYEDEYYDEELSEEDSCNVLGIELRGDLVTYISPGETDEQGYAVSETASEEISLAIESGENDNSTKAILLEIDSWGGSGVAAEEIMNDLKNAKKPTVVLIRELGLSAAYYSAIGADTIFASRNSDVGSIGITMSYLDYSEQNKKEGIEYIEISSGKFKDAGDPDRPLTEEDKEIFIRDTKILHENFIEDVAEHRNLDIEKVRELADGSSMLGEMALENGLIDRIGGLPDVKEYLKEKIGEEVEVCW